MLERHRGRAIHMLPPLPPSPGLPCGLCVAGADADYIFCVGGPTGLHRDHIMLHEIGHLLGGHRGMLPGDGLARLMPNLEPETVRRVLGRTAYGTEEETEAETFASLVLHRSRAIRREPRPDLASPMADVLDRLEETWGRGRVG